MKTITVVAVALFESGGGEPTVEAPSKHVELWRRLFLFSANRARLVAAIHPQHRFRLPVNWVDR